MSNYKGIILYYADYCIHCKNFKPEWNKLKDMLKNSNIYTKEYEAEQNPEIMQKNNIQGYPTIHLVAGNNIEEYEGNRTAQDILNKLNNNKVGGGGKNYESKYYKYKAKYMYLKAKYL